MSLLDISVVIPTRNRIESLIDTIYSFNNNKYKPKEIIVIDQSDEQNCKIIEEKLSEYNKNIKIDLKYIYQPEASLTKARNTGINKSKYEIIIFSDDDIYVEKNTLYNIYQSFENNAHISLISAVDKLMEVESQNKFNSLMGYIFLRKSLNKNSGYLIKSMFGRYPKNITKVIETEWAMGYFFALRKDILHQGNIYFDENLKSYAYAEDLDFTYRYFQYSKKIGKIMVIDPQVLVEHRVSKEWRLTSRVHSKMIIVNREYLSYKIFPNNLISRIMTRWANCGEFIRRLIIKDNPMDVVIAQYVCDRNRKYLKNGIIPKDIY